MRYFFIGVFSFIVIAYLSSLANASENLYIGVSGGFSHLNYDVSGDAYEYIVKEAPLENAVIDSLGGNLNINTNKSSSVQKIYFGNRLDKRFGYEFFYMSIDNFQASASANVNKNIPIYNQTKYNLNGNASYIANIDLNGFGVRMNVFGQVTENIDFFGGLGLMAVKSNITTRTNVNGYTGLTNDLKYFNNSTYSKESVSGIVPVFSVGTVYQITDDFAIRGEYERIGHPLNDLSINIASIGLQYSL